MGFGLGLVKVKETWPRILLDSLTIFMKRFGLIGKTVLKMNFSIGVAGLRM